MTGITFNSILVYFSKRQDKEFARFNNNLDRLQPDIEHRP